MVKFHNNFYTAKNAWKSPDLPVYLFVYLIVGLLADPNLNMLGDLDTCWLIRTGELIWENGCLPNSDVFSFTHYGKPWVLYQWGFELILAVLHMLAGLGGVVWISALIVGFSYCILFNYFLGLKIHRIVCIVLIALVMQINSFNWIARPNIASILFYIILLISLEKYRRNLTNHIYLMPLLFLVWTNVHLAFTLGLIVLLIYGFWASLGPQSFFQSSHKSDKKIIIIFSLCFFVTMINPYGYKLFGYLFNLSQGEFMNMNIIELKSPDFHSSTHFTLILLLLFIFWFGHHPYSGRFVLLTLMSITFFMALYSARHIPYFSIPASIHLAYSWEARSTINGYNNRHNLSMNFKGAGWGLTAAISCLIFVILIHHWRPEFYYFDKNRVPIEASLYLENNFKDKEPLNVFTTGAGGQWNDYLIYRLYPHVRVFIDTRFDMYGDKFFKHYLSLSNKIKCDLNSLNHLPIDFIILKKSGNFAKVDYPWKLTHEDEKTMVFRNLVRAPEN